MQSLPGYRIAVDIGGTFTDTVLIGAKNRILASCKTPTTQENPTEGAMDGVRRVLNEGSIAIGDVTHFVHGTTLATNALIERRGARTAVVTTHGFRDILEIAYERRYSQYDINLSKPDLIVPRRRCFTILERMLADGTVHVPLDEAEIPRLLAQIDDCGAEAVAICFLHSYANGAHEHRLREILHLERPHLEISLSCETSPEAREFERLCTTVANAYVQPIMARYLIELQSTLQTEGLSCPIMMMTSGGGMTTLETAAQHPIRLVESGPAGGALLAARIAESLGEPSVLSFDMGGTTAKLCLIDDYKPQTSRKFEISRAERFIRGSGMPVRIPVIEMIEIGAGGGSIASVDRLGRIGVGPESAGSEPGPAAFAKGGTRPTVTDADVEMGFIEPGLFAEGRLRIDQDAARSAVDLVGTPLDLDASAAAFGISEIVDENMASAGRTHAVEAGKDITGRAMIAFGGNGPLHTTRVARRARVNRIIVPLNPGVGSAVGFLFAPIAFEIVRSRYTLLDQLDVGDINAFFDRLESEAKQVVTLGAVHTDLSTRRTAFMRYHGQGHEIEIELPNRDLVTGDVSLLVGAFETEYSRQFSRAVPGMSIEILNWAVSVSTPPVPIDQVSKVSSVQSIPVVKTKTVTCDVSGDQIEAAVFMRDALNVGDQITGPALIVEPQTTTLVSADFDAEILADLSILLTKKTGA